MELEQQKEELEEVKAEREVWCLLLSRLCLHISLMAAPFAVVHTPLLSLTASPSS